MNIRIAQYADLQTKVRTKNLSANIKQSFSSIENIIFKTKSEIVVIDGDIFEYSDPNDIERELLYNHLINILKTPTVKEVALIDGNHDYDKNQQKTPISIFKSIAHTLLKDDVNNNIIDKLNYLEISKPTKSIAYPNNILWLPYSLRDGGIYNKKLYQDVYDLTSTTLNIALFHGMVQEFIVDSGLPVKKVNRLFEINDIQGDLKLGGDIHQNWNKNNFYYPGSIFECNHGEGSYLKFYGKDKSQFKLADKKFVNIFNVELSTKTWSTEKEIIDNNLNYLTIDISNPSSEISLQHILDNLKTTLNNFNIDSNTLIFKIKLNSDYQKFRSDIIKYLSKYTPFDIDVVDIKTLDNDKIKTSVDLKSDENNLDDDTDKTLTKDIIIKLFNDGLDHIDDKTKLFSEVKDEVLMQFTNDLDFHFNVGKNFNNELISVETNGFQKLGPNKIDCDFFGLCRIVASNGMGKTQFYNMIYWLHKGIIYPYLKKNLKTNNNMLVFNNKLVDNNEVWVKANYVINGTKVVIKRTVKREWKTNTLKSMKLSSMRNKFIAKTTQRIEITIYKVNEEGVTNEIKVDGDKAERLLTQWFGNAIDNLLIINDVKILALLNQSPENLEKLLLEYIGNDFVQSMIDSLSDVKNKIMDVAKPELSDSELENKLIELRADLKVNKTKLDNYDIQLKDNDLLINKYDLQAKEENNHLINLGNIPQLITEKQSSIDILNSSINEFTIVEPKPTPILDVNVIKPTLTLDETKYNQEKLNLTTKQQELINCKNSLIQEVKVKIDSQKSIIDSTNNKINSIISNKSNLLFENVNSTKLSFESSTYFQEIFKLKTSFQSSLQELNVKINNNSNDIVNKNAELLKLNDKINNGVCPECNSILDITKEELEQLHVDVVNLKTKINDINQTKIDLQSNKTTIDNKITICNNIIDNKDILNQTFVNDLQNHYVDVCKLKDLYDNSIKIKNEYVKLTLDQKINDDVEALKLMTDINNKNTIINKLNTFLNFDDNIFKIEDEKVKSQHYHDYFKINNEISVINKFIIDSDALKVKYNNDLSNYNNSITEHNKLIESVRLFNDNLIEKSNQHNLNVDKLSIETKDLFELQTNKLAKYNQHKNEIKIIDKNLAEIKASMLILNKSISDCNIISNTYEQKIIKFTKDLELFNNWNQKKHIYKYYDVMVKKILPKSIFNYYRKTVNYKFNELLSDINFDLEWSSDGNLYKIEYNNEGEKNFTVINGVSGMETIFLGLSFIYSVTELNYKNRLSHIFIDELSGKLNKGKNDDPDMTTDYQELLLLLLSKFKNSKIFIIDHVITNMFETKTLKLSYNKQEKITSIKEI